MDRRKPREKHLDNLGICANRKYLFWLFCCKNNALAVFELQFRAIQSVKQWLAPCSGCETVLQVALSPCARRQCSSPIHPAPGARLRHSRVGRLQVTKDTQGQHSAFRAPYHETHEEHEEWNSMNSAAIAASSNNEA